MFLNWLRFEIYNGLKIDWYLYKIELLIGSWCFYQNYVIPISKLERTIILWKLKVEYWYKKKSVNPLFSAGKWKKFIKNCVLVDDLCISSYEAWRIFERNACSVQFNWWPSTLTVILLALLEKLLFAIRHLLYFHKYS